MSSPGRTQPSMAEQSLDSLPILQHLSICEIIGPCYRNIFLPHAEITQNWCWCECWRKTYQDYFQFCNDVLCRLYSTFGPLVSRRLSGDINIIPIEWTTCLSVLVFPPIMIYFFYSYLYIIFCISPFARGKYRPTFTLFRCFFSYLLERDLLFGNRNFITGDSASDL
jgi:hypothetical protein